MYIVPQNAVQTQRRRSLAGRMTNVLWHIAEALPSARQGTIQNNYRVSIATSMVLNCTLVTYIMMTAEVGLLYVV